MAEEEKTNSKYDYQDFSFFLVYIIYIITSKAKIEKSRLKLKYTLDSETE